MEDVYERCVVNTRRESELDATGDRRTDPISVPRFPNVLGIPDVFWKVRSPFLDVDKLNEFCVQVWVAERSVRHERVVEMFWVGWVSLQRVELRELGLEDANEK